MTDIYSSYNYFQDIPLKIDIKICLSCQCYYSGQPKTERFVILIFTEFSLNFSQKNSLTCAGCGGGPVDRVSLQRGE